MTITSECGFKSSAEACSIIGRQPFPKFLSVDHTPYSQFALLDPAKLWRPFLQQFSSFASFLSIRGPTLCHRRTSPVERSGVPLHSAKSAGAGDRSAIPIVISKHRIVRPWCDGGSLSSGAGTDRFRNIEA
jgi:hypothetical protein